jgi:uncharacterized repeat protein (TIGR03803 family)
MQWNHFPKIVRTALATPAAILVLATSLSAISDKNLYVFTGRADGGAPESVLVADATGNFYGTTERLGVVKGPGGCGTVFKLARNPDGTWTHSVIYNFAELGSTDGCFPEAGLVFDQAGNLYGTTFGGGNSNCIDDGVLWGFCGTVFKLAHNLDGTWTESVIYAFSGPDGSNPRASLASDAAGNLYGTTLAGGTYRMGTVFQLTPNSDGSWTERVLHQFTGGKDGGYLNGRLSLDATGALYGTADSGGACPGCGVVFKLILNADGSWSEQVLHAFTGGKDGSNPDGGVIFDAGGSLYGTTHYGGAYWTGTVFRLVPNADGSWTEHVLHWFTGGKDGGQPLTDLIMDAEGVLYGTTTNGGSYQNGTAFRLTHTASGWSERVLWSFRGHPGKTPCAGLFLDGVGNLFGTTRGDYTSTFGTVFEITR